MSDADQPPELEIGIAIRGEVVCLKFPHKGNEIECYTSRHGAMQLASAIVVAISDTLDREEAGE